MTTVAPTAVLHSGDLTSERLDPHNDADLGGGQGYYEDGWRTHVFRGEIAGEDARENDSGGQDDFITEEEWRRNSIIRRYRRRNANGACVLLLITVLFVLALYWTAESWSSVGGNGLTWTDTECIVTNVTAEEGRKFQGKDTLWRSKFVVDFDAKQKHESSPRILRKKTAWRWDSDIYNMTKDQALKYQSLFRINGKYACWVVHNEGVSSESTQGTNSEVGNGGWRISLSPTTNIKPRSVDVALISTCTVGLLLVSFMITLMYIVSAVEILQDIERPLPSTSAVLPNSLSEAQVKAICAVATETMKLDTETQRMFDRDPWDCAICLDDEGGESGRLAQLTCRHVFHTKCVRGWLMRGGVTCPLCNYRLDPVDERLNSKANACALEEEIPASTSESGEIFGDLPQLPNLAMTIIGMHAAPEPAYRGPQSSLTSPESAEFEEGTEHSQSGQSENTDSMSDIAVPQNEQQASAATLTAITGSDSDCGEDVCAKNSLNFTEGLKTEPVRAAQLKSMDKKAPGSRSRELSKSTTEGKKKLHNNDENEQPLL